MPASLTMERIGREVYAVTDGLIQLAEAGRAETVREEPRAKARANRCLVPVGGRSQRAAGQGWGDAYPAVRDLASALGALPKEEVIEAEGGGYCPAADQAQRAGGHRMATGAVAFGDATGPPPLLIPNSID